MRMLLIVTLLLQGVTATISGVELIRTNGLGMSIEFLAKTPFTSFFIPGLILTIIIGGTSLTAAYFQIKKLNYSEEVSAIAGFGILIWIFTQMYMIEKSFFLQIVYFASGILILILTFILLRRKATTNQKVKIIK